MIRVDAYPSDDEQFLELVVRVVSAEAAAKPVVEIFVIRIDNWFDGKWRNYAGRGRVAFGSFLDPSFVPDTALDEFHRDGKQTTFPPFHPNRVVKESFYRLIGGRFELCEDEGRASLMIYRADGEEVSTWNASFSRDPHWRPMRTLGIARARLLEYSNA